MILGKRLKDLRERAGLSLDEAARALRVNSLTVRRMEKAEVGLKILYVEKLLHTYGVGPQETGEFLKLADRANEPGWWHRYREVLPGWFTAYVSLESDATTLRVYEPHYVTGLLQTRDYARAILRSGFPDDSDDELEHRVDLRLQRQDLLTKPDAPTLWVVMGEAVLHTLVGGPGIMRDQLDHLLDVTAELPNVSVDIIPFAAGPHIGAFGPYTYFRFDAPELPDVVYTEGVSGGAYFDQRADVALHLEAHNRMSLLTTAPGSDNLMHDMRKEYER